MGVAVYRHDEEFFASKPITSSVFNGKETADALIIFC